MHWLASKGIKSQKGQPKSLPNKMLKLLEIKDL
jgi:hypothetical protein